MKKLISQAKVKLKRLQRNLHPFEMRKKLTYLSARATKHVSVNTRLEEYINNLIAKGETIENLYEIKQLEAGERSYLQIPISEARFLEVLARSLGAKNILEIGTFCGFSTAFLARALPEGGVVFTCDEDKRYIETARKFWEHVGVTEKIHFELGTALSVLQKMTEDKPSLEFFDFAFIDADKENYRMYIELSMKLLRTGGVLLVDNTLWKGLVQYKESHDNSAEYIKAVNGWIFEEFGHNASIIPAWDGLTMIVKA